MPAPWQLQARRALSGAAGGIVNLAGFVTLGLVAFAPLGAAAAPLGIPAAFATVALAGLLAAIIGRSAVPVFTPSFATALILAGLVARLAADPASFRADGSIEPARILAVTGAAVFLYGLLQIALGRLGLGRLAAYAPAPVLAGFLSGVGILLILSQVPALLGLTPDTWQRDGLAALSPQAIGPLALGAATAGAIWWLVPRGPRVPAPLLVLCLGFAVFHAARVGLPDLWLGQVLGAMPPAEGILDTARSITEPTLWNHLLSHLPAIVFTAVLLALVGSLESMLALRSIDQQFQTRHDGGHELRTLGLGNLCGGLLCALPGVVLRAQATSVAAAGGRGRASGIGAALVYALLYAFARGLLEIIPTAVLAGVMVTVGCMLVDRSSLQLLRRSLAGRGTREGWTSLVIVAAVCATTVVQGVALGVALGLLLASLSFMRGMNLSLVRARHDGAARPSRRLWPPALAQQLQPQRHRIVVLELEGALFFGNAERLSRQADELPSDARYLVVDLHRVSTVDESAVTLLRQLGPQLARRGVHLLLAGLSEASATGRCLAAFAMLPGAPVPWFPDADRALEHAERGLLAQEVLDLPAVPLANSELFRGLSAGHRGALAGVMLRCTLPAGGWLFREGDVADSLYVLVSGSISLMGGSGEQRLNSLSPGLVFGEMSVLDGERRSASARIDTAVDLQSLPATALAALRRSNPALYGLVHRNIAVQLSSRLRLASTAWRAASL